MRPDPVVSFSIANINPGSVRAEFMLSMMATIQQERINAQSDDAPPVRLDQFFAHHSGPYLDVHRNTCALWFLNEVESDYLLFIDSDIGFKPSDPFKLIQTAHENGVTILTGVYYNQFDNELRALVHEWGESPKFKHVDDTPCMDMIPLTNVAINTLYPQDKPHPIDGCGAGFLAIHRSVFTDMQPHYALPLPFFAELVIDDVWMGEDLTFCIRAKAVGHQPYVLPSIELDHHKMCNVRSSPGRVM